MKKKQPVIFPAYDTPEQYARQHGLTLDAVRERLRAGTIRGAVQLGPRTWRIAKPATLARVLGART